MPGLPSPRRMASSEMSSGCNLWLETFVHFSFFFLKILFFETILFHIGAEEQCMPGHCVFYGEFGFLVEHHLLTVV